MDVEQLNKIVNLITSNECKLNQFILFEPFKLKEKRQ